MIFCPHMKYFDAHCHIQFPQYAEDVAELQNNMKEAGVGGLVVGVDFDSSEKAIQTVESAEGQLSLYATVGLHPNHDEEQFNEAGFRELAQHPKVVAIGECGLDYYRPENSESVKGPQKGVFEQHIALAAELDKPLMVHIRSSKGTMNAYEDAIEILTQAKARYGNVVRGNSHFHTGNVEVTKRLIELGFTCSFTAVLTFTNDYDEVIRFLPLSHILTETDSPYVAPVERRGKRNDPLAVRNVVEAIARIRETDEETIREAVLANAKRVFHLEG